MQGWRYTWFHCWAISSLVGLLIAEVASVKWPSGPRVWDGVKNSWFTNSDGSHEIRIKERQPRCGHVEGEGCKKKETFPVGEVSDFIPPREEIIT